MVVMPRPMEAAGMEEDLMEVRDVVAVHTGGRDAAAVHTGVKEVVTYHSCITKWHDQSIKRVASDDDAIKEKEEL